MRHLVAISKLWGQEAKRLRNAKAVMLSDSPVEDGRSIFLMVTHSKVQTDTLMEMAMGLVL